MSDETTLAADQRTNRRRMIYVTERIKVLRTELDALRKERDQLRSELTGQD